MRRGPTVPGPASLLMAGWLLASCTPAMTGTEPAAGNRPAGERTPAPGDLAPPPPTAAPPRQGAARPALRQDDVSISLQAGPLLLKVTPLAASVTELLAPDTRRRLDALRGQHGAPPGTQRDLFLVSFFSHQPDASFSPGDVQLLQDGRLLQPVRVVAVTGGWGLERLRQQETQVAVYEFAGPLAYDRPMTLRYGGVESDAWRRIIHRLERERARVGRTGGEGGGGGGAHTGGDTGAGGSADGSAAVGRATTGYRTP